MVWEVREPTFCDLSFENGVKTSCDRPQKKYQPHTFGQSRYTKNFDFQFQKLRRGGEYRMRFLPILRSLKNTFPGEYGPRNYAHLGEEIEAFKT